MEGYNPNTSAFFVELFKRVFDTDIIVVRNYSNADILCENRQSPRTSFINKKEWKYSFLVTGESVVSGGVLPDDYKKFQYFLSGADSNIGIKWIKFPLITSYLFCNARKQLPPVTTVPKQLACCVIANPKGQVRNKFLSRLEAKMPVSYGGPYKNNVGYTVRGDHNSDELLTFMRSHKFVITMENNEEDYYITEKLCNGLFAGVIPVYWGSKHVGEYINKERILHLENDSDEEIDRIIATMIEMDDTTYLNKVNIDPFLHKDMMELMVEELKHSIITS